MASNKGPAITKEIFEIKFSNHIMEVSRKTTFSHLLKETDSPLKDSKMHLDEISGQKGTKTM